MSPQPSPTATREGYASPSDDPTADANATIMTPDHDALAGQLLADRYRLVEMIGRGGIGTVWRTIDGRSGAELAS